MSYPGSNILRQALRVIASQTFKYYKFLGRAENAIGYDVSSYADPILIKGSVQPTPRNMYELYGLDLNQRHVTVYTPNNIIEIDRDRSSDQIMFECQAYQVLSNPAPWFLIDGWMACIAVGIPNIG